MLVDMRTPSGLVVHVREQAVERLVKAGYTHVGAARPRKRATKGKPKE